MDCPFDPLKKTLDIGYSGDGTRIAQDFYIPVLKRSKMYYRLSGYFSIDSLVITAAGLAGLIKNGGRMKLVLGAHDIRPDLISAQKMSETSPEKIIEFIGSKIAGDLDNLADTFTKERLQAVAWMIVNGSLEIKVAIPKKTYFQHNRGIFHEKVLIMEDSDGCAISAYGSPNETRNAYDANGESLTIHMSWRPGGIEYINKHRRDFNAIWNENPPDYVVFPLPDAIKLKLRERFYPQQAPENDPAEHVSLDISRGYQEKIKKFIPISRFINEIASLQGFIHLSLGPVRLYPHQKFTADYVLTKFPYRCLLADEVGLGKTLEAGAIIKRLIDERQVERVLILSPKNVARQWMEELKIHFGLNFRLFETSPTRRFIDADGDEIRLDREMSPFTYPCVDFLVMSWHYARRNEIRDLLLQDTRGFDLVIIDEAHAARKKRIPGRPIEPTKLNDLCTEIGVSCPHVLLLSATPVQMRSLEALDLLRILGLGGRWVHESHFERFYTILQKEDSEIDDDEWTFALQMIQSYASRSLARIEIDRIITSIVPADDTEFVLRMMYSGQDFAQTVGRLKNKTVLIPPDGIQIQDIPRYQSVLRQLIMSFSPLQWYMVRNTRSRLSHQGFRFPERDVREEPVTLSPEHVTLLERLDHYLHNQYAAYERLINPENRGTIGFVRCIYHQRFVSSFSAAYNTISNRLEFLDGLLSHDEDAMRRVAEKFFADIDDEFDEFDYIEATRDLLDRPNVETLIRDEQRVLQDLQTSLAEYAPEHPSLDDPKLRQVHDAISDLWLSRQKKVLIFSKYVDTITAIHHYLLQRGFNREEIALYTGAGGQIFDVSQDAYKSVGKEEVRKALDGPTVGIVLCTDAASEGLNLQAAGALINVDMPWNPAKVEQRIGRIDRLGQTADAVSIVNTWYPASIEANMYGRLFERKEIYHLVVGPAQDIFSEQLRMAFDINARGEQLRVIVAETFQKIDEVKEQTARFAGVFSGVQWDGELTPDDEIIHRLVTYLNHAAKMYGFKTEIANSRLSIIGDTNGVPPELERWNGASLISGKPNALTPVHPIVTWFVNEFIRLTEEQALKPEFSKSYYVIKDNRRIGSLFEIGEDGFPRQISGSEILDVMDNLLAHAQEVKS